MNQNVFYAISAAALFGASTPLAKLLVGDMSPVLLGGLLYLGSGVGPRPVQNPAGQRLATIGNAPR